MLTHQQNYMFPKCESETLCTSSVVSILPELVSLTVQQVIYNYFNGLILINIL